MRQKTAKIFFGFGFFMALSFGSGVLFCASAATVDVTAFVGTVICGNGIVEGAEECDISNTGCAVNYHCDNTCVCIQDSSGCTPGSPACTFGACVGGIRTGTCNDGCSTYPISQTCVSALCGDGALDSGEECDDGNTLSGDCCSLDCEQELMINGVTHAAGTDSALIEWATPCQSTAAVLEWGETSAVSDGVVSGLSGSAYSYLIDNLSANTVYYFRITASSGSLEAVATGSFLTAGGAEICDNGLDDDHNGLCDYPASECTDGAAPGDGACACEPDFDCVPQLCENGQQTVDCTDQAIPKCQPDYSYGQDCEICPGVTCGLCQFLDEASCTCVDQSDCCGNNLCEPPAEDPDTCLADCPAECVSEWDCTAWEPEPCPEDGIQTRECFDANACLMPINPPDLTQTCGLTCPGLSCGSCQQINTAACVCEQLLPCCGNGFCETGETYEQCPADCILPCTPSWTCSAWSACVDGSESRECQDLNNCNLNLGRPPEIRACGGSCEVACTTCETLNSVGCICEPIAPCCGNRICEATENSATCPVDCGLPPGARLTLPQCLDGLDNDNDGLIDYPADLDCKKPYDSSELGLAQSLRQVLSQMSRVINSPAVQIANTQVAAPLLVTAVAVNAVASVSAFNFISYLRYIFSQPLASLFRRKRRKWGTVYNALTKQPVDLAIVRLYQVADNRLVQSRVTDKIGRFMFLVAPGHYYLTVTKPNYVFPTAYLKEKKEDITFLDLYHGEMIEVTEDKVSITPNIPLDPLEDARPVKKVIVQYYLRKVQYAAAFSAVPLAAVSYAISPSWFTFALLIFHTLLYILFRRLGYEKAPKNWGIIYDHENKKPLTRAIARIYDKQYNKLLETRVTDNHGRYSFLVNKNLYYVTAEKLGYNKYQSSEIDLISKDREAVVGMDIGLQRAGMAASQTEVEPADKLKALAPVKPPATVTPPPMPAQLPTEQTVDRDQLQALLDHKINSAAKLDILSAEDQAASNGQAVVLEKSANADLPPAAPPSEAEPNKPEPEKSIFG